VRRRTAGLQRRAAANRVDTPIGLCYNKAPFDRFDRLDGHFVHLDRLGKSQGRR